METWYSAYLEGDWKSILHQSEQQIAMKAVVGDEVLWSKAFFYYGCIALYLQQPHIYQTVYQQVEIERAKGISDPRIQAYFHRFLAIYASFEGKTSIADAHFNQCIQLFAETGDSREETLALIEYACLVLLYTQNWKGIEYVLTRLKHLNSLLHETKVRDWHDFLYGYKTLSIGYPNDSSDTSSNSVSNIIIETLAFQREQKKYPQIKTLESWEKGHTIHPFLTPWIRFIYFQEAWQQKDVTQLKERIYQLQGLSQSLNHKFWVSISNVLAEKYIGAKTKKELELQGSIITEMGAGETWRKWLQQIHSNSLEEYTPFFFITDLQSEKSQTNICLKENDHKAIIHGFGSLSISSQKNKIPQSGWNRKLSRDLLIYMLIHAGGSVSRDRLLDVFFQDESEQKARNRLYVAIHHLRDRFREVLDIKDSIIVLKEGAVYLNRSIIDSVDIWDYQKLCSVGNQLWADDPEAAITLFQKANQIFIPQLFTGIDDLEWLDEFREDLRQKHLKILRKMARYFWRKGNHEDLEEILTEIIQLDPFHEDGYRMLIIWLTKQNRMSESKIWYERLREMLEKHVGVKPSFSIQKIENSNIRGLFDETGTD